MTDTIDPIILNVLYAAAGGGLTLLFMWLGCKMFNRAVSFNISEELGKGNIAVGLMVMGLLIGIGIAVGLTVGLGLN